MIEDGKLAFIDLFAGIGGFRKGFEAAGYGCVFTSEKDKFARNTYEANYAITHHIDTDITNLHAKDIPAHNILLAGFPCQPFSMAGKRGGFLDKLNGTLFFDIVRILSYHRPQAFVLENVKGLLTHRKGKTFKTIRDVLSSDLGYHVQYKVINSIHWVPQKRERVFIVGLRETPSFDFSTLAAPTQRHVLGDILEQDVDEKYTLSDRMWASLQKHKEKHMSQGNGFGYTLHSEGDVARTLSARYFKDGSEILLYQDGANPRRLTPRECSRLMGFDTPQGHDFLIPVSDTQAYKQFGNAVVPFIVEEIAKTLKPYINKNETTWK